MAVNLRGGGNLMMQILMMGLENQNRQKAQQREQQFTTQRDISQRQFAGQQAGLGREADITAGDLLNQRGIEAAGLQRGFDVADVASEREFEAQRSEEERERTKAAKEQELATLSETDRKARLEEDTRNEALMTRLGVDFDPSVMYTDSMTQTIINAEQGGQVESPDFGNFVIERVTEARNTMPPEQYDQLVGPEGQYQGWLATMSDIERQRVMQAVIQMEATPRPQAVQPQPERQPVIPSSLAPLGGPLGGISPLVEGGIGNLLRNIQQRRQQ